MAAAKMFNFAHNFEKQIAKRRLKADAQAVSRMSNTEHFPAAEPCIMCQ